MNVNLHANPIVQSGMPIAAVVDPMYARPATIIRRSPSVDASCRRQTEVPGQPTALDWSAREPSGIDWLGGGRLSLVIVGKLTSLVAKESTKLFGDGAVGFGTEDGRRGARKDCDDGGKVKPFQGRI